MKNLPPAPFKFPQKARYGRTIPKSTIYGYTKAKHGLKQNFIQQVESITWAYKLAPETINLPAGPFVKEIQVIEIRLKPGTQFLDKNLLLALDKAISHPLLFDIWSEEQHSYTMSWKRPHETNKDHWVVETYFSGPVLNDSAQANNLPQALNMESQYENLLRFLMPPVVNSEETIPAQVERLQRIIKLEKQIKSIGASLAREKQFNRRVALNQQIRNLKRELHPLTVLQSSKNN